jgi:magnesium-transporting ATPase (P-type)
MVIYFQLNFSDYEFDISINGSAFDYIVNCKKNDIDILGRSASDILSIICKNGKVFSRMSPSQKASLIRELQSESNIKYIIKNR